MTKEDIKIGVVFREEHGCKGMDREVVYMNNLAFCAQFDDDSICVYEYSEIEESWQKVEPVKRYWKYYLKEIVNGRLEMYITEDIDSLIWKRGFEMLKEPTEITLDEL